MWRRGNSLMSDTLASADMRASTGLAGAVLLAAFFLALAPSAFAQPPAPPKPANPLDAIPAIVDAFKSHSLVALGETHGHRERQDFLINLIADPRFLAVATDIVVELGNSRYQDLMDRFVSGEEVPLESLQRVWRDTTQQQAAPWNLVDVFLVVREINATLPKTRQLRVLLGEPSIDWDRMQTEEDLRKWSADPASNRDWFAARLVEREVLGRGRRALLTYGAGHFVRQTTPHSLVTLLERDAGVKVFNIWTNVTSLRLIQNDIDAWPVPSLLLVRNTALGLENFAAYFPQTVFSIPPEWRVPMQDQFDAVIYLGPITTMAFPSAWPCGDPAFPERLRRMALHPLTRSQMISVQTNCIPQAPR